MATDSAEDTDFARQLRAQLELRGWSNAELARQSGLSRAYVGRVLSGEREPSFEAARAMAAAFGLRIALVAD